MQTGLDQPEPTVCGVFPAHAGDLVIAAQMEDAWCRFTLLVGGDELAAGKRLCTQNKGNGNRHPALGLDAIGPWRSRPGPPALRR